MDSHGQYGNFSLRTGRNKVCQNQEKGSSTSLVKYIKRKNSLVRMDPSRCTVGKQEASRFQVSNH